MVILPHCEYNGTKTHRGILITTMFTPRVTGECTFDFSTYNDNTTIGIYKYSGINNILSHICSDNDIVYFNKPYHQNSSLLYQFNDHFTCHIVDTIVRLPTVYSVGCIRCLASF